jgi:alpha-tubulin suppressor-like RCC1 family protein
LRGTATVPVQVFAGAYQTCIINELEQAVCWGKNTYGQLGQGSTGSLIQRPEDTSPIALGNGVAVRKIAVGSNHTCALLAFGERTGAVSCWGSNVRGRLGLGISSEASVSSPQLSGGLPVLVNLGTDAQNRPLEAVDLSAGFEHTCAVIADGRLKCWGGNTSGQLGNGSRNATGSESSQMGNSLVAVELGGIGARSVSAGAGHTCVVLEDGGTRCWGDNFYGQLGQSVDDDQIGTDPQDFETLGSIDLGTDSQAQSVVASQGAFTCVLDQMGQVRCFGKAVYNENTSSAFHGVLGTCWARSSYNASAVSCWSNSRLEPSNSYGYYHTDMSASLKPVDTGSDMIEKLVSGNAFSCVLASDHTVKCWGVGERGQLGAGEFGNLGAGENDLGSNLGAALAASDGAVGIAAGAEHACAVLSNNTVKCWGGSTDNATGLLSMGQSADVAGAATAPVVYDGR